MSCLSDSQLKKGFEVGLSSSCLDHVEECPECSQRAHELSWAYSHEREAEYNARSWIGRLFSFRPTPKARLLLERSDRVFYVDESGTLRNFRIRIGQIGILKNDRKPSLKELYLSGSIETTLIKETLLEKEVFFEWAMVSPKIFYLLKRGHEVYPVVTLSLEVSWSPFPFFGTTTLILKRS